MSLNNSISAEPRRTGLLTEVDYQIHLLIERIRVAELLYDPSMMGIDQAGLIECTQRVIASLNESQQTKLQKRIFVTGGNTLYPGFCQRLANELRAILPFTSIFHIHHATYVLFPLPFPLL
jgi:actin-related protein 5